MNKAHFNKKALLVDVVKRRIIPAEIKVEDGMIAAILPCEAAECKSYLMPGFIDAHVHVESSLLIPSEFARLAVVHGMVATVSDPHEIANVCGLDGVHYMLDNAAKTDFKFYFGAPSCVPATSFETAGAVLGLEETRQLINDDRIAYLAEMMNFPGVLSNDEQVMEKIRLAHQAGKPVDGHAPGLMGELAKQYAAAGITTDHECFTLAEALDKIKYGMHIQIREGSAARNFDALHPLLGLHPDKVMFCSDDKHPDSLLDCHINGHVKRALALGYDLFDVLCAASLNIKNHYKLQVGMLQIGDPADFIEVDDLKHFNILSTWINGKLLAEKGASFIQPVSSHTINNFNAEKIGKEQLRIPADGLEKVKVIGALEGQLITHPLIRNARIHDNLLESDIEEDVLKIAVLNRYAKALPALAFINGIGIRKGAFAATVAHDSHNIVAVACDDDSLQKVINLLIEAQGGLAATDGKRDLIMPLPVAGLMTNIDAYEAANQYMALDNFVKQELKSTLRAPFMTLSFMALLVIPHLKLSDKGLFDGDKFCFTSLKASAE